MLILTGIELKLHITIIVMLLNKKIRFNLINLLHGVLICTNGLKYDLTYHFPV